MASLPGDLLPACGGIIYHLRLENIFFKVSLIELAGENCFLSPEPRKRLGRAQGGSWRVHAGLVQLRLVLEPI